jgi:hypothetical protein
MPLGLKAQTLAHFLEGRLHLPASDKPRDDLSRLDGKVGAQQSLGFKLFLRVSDQHPTQRYGGQAGAVPNRRCRDHLDGALLATVPASDRDRFPLSFGIRRYDGEVRNSLAFEARPS